MHFNADVQVYKSSQYRIQGPSSETNKSQVKTNEAIISKEQVGGELLILLFYQLICNLRKELLLMFLTLANYEYQKGGRIDKTNLF